MESYFKPSYFVYFINRVVGNEESKKAQEEMVEGIDGLICDEVTSFYTVIKFLSLFRKYLTLQMKHVHDCFWYQLAFNKSFYEIWAQNVWEKFYSDYN